MPASKTAGTKRKAAGSDGYAVKSSPKVVYMVQCTRKSFVQHRQVMRDESEDDFYKEEDAYSDAEQDAVGAHLAAARCDGTWVYGTPAPGSSSDDDNNCNSDQSVVVFRSLKAANAYAAEVCDALQDNPPFHAEAEGSDTAVRKSKTAEGCVRYQREQTFHHDACCSDSTVVCSTLTVQVVAATLM